MTFEAVSEAVLGVRESLPNKSTPYSMNSLFSEFFRKFSGGILGVCETIWRLFGGHLGGVLWGFRGKDYSTSKRKNWKKLYFLLFKIALDSLFIEGGVVCLPLSVYLCACSRKASAQRCTRKVRTKDVQHFSHKGPRKARARLCARSGRLSLKQYKQLLLNYQK